MSKSPLKFGAIGAIGSMFGTMGNNQMINSLTNANALAAQQAAARQVNRNAIGAAQPVGSGASGVGGINDLSQMVMDGSMATFDPAAQQAGMGIFGSRDARNRALHPSAIMMHSDVQKQIDAKKEEIKKAKAEGGDPDIVFELKSDLMDLEKELKTAKEAHNSPANYGSPLNDDREIPQWRKEHNEKFAAKKAAIAAEKARLLEITRARREQTYGTDQSNFGKK
tara:strand:+ start:746 stop:1417 length:672 start_codon:yes stop_codon:yes gene_type:complete